MCRHKYPLRNTLSTLNTWRPRQNVRHFPDNIFKRIFLNENVWIFINISLKFIPKGPIDNISIGSDKGMVLNRRQAVVWTNGGLNYWRIYASSGLELIHDVFIRVLSIAFVQGPSITVFIWHSF